MPVAQSRRLVLAAILAAATLGGCGGGDADTGADAPRRITEVLQTGLTSSDAATICDHSLSTGLIVRVYGSRDRCLAVERAASASRAAAGTAVVSRVKVDGDRATAFVTLRGGDQAGAHGALTVVRQDGAWRLDDLSTEFLRSEFNAGLTSGADLEANLTACVGKRVVALDDASLRALAFGAMGGRPQAQAQLRGLVTECIRALSGPSSGQVS